MSAAAHDKGTDLIGTVIRERYKVLRLLGEGGMGGVYECEHVEVGKHVAVKFVSAVHAQSPQIAARLKREARSTGALESDHIVQVFDAGEDPVHGLFLVMELLRGKDLAVMLDGGKRVSVIDAALIAYQAALGLERAHDAGIIHRDLKPANVFVCEKQDGRAVIKLVDFGIAKLVRDANEEGLDPGITRAGAVLGTPQYMSPEQAQGLDTLDLRTDVYSLGAVVFELITGEAPHPNMPTYEQTILRIVMSDAPRLSQRVPDVPRDLDDLVASMLSRDPNGRPPHMRAVRAALTRMFPDLEQRNLPFSQLAMPPGAENRSAPPAAATVMMPPSAIPMNAPGASGSGAPPMRAMSPSGAMHGPSAPGGSWPPQQVPPRTSAGVSFESRAEPSKGPPFAIIGGILFVLLLLGGGGVWIARAKLIGALSTPGVGITQSSVTAPDIAVPSAASTTTEPSAVASAASAAPSATHSAAAQTAPPTSATSQTGAVSGGPKGPRLPSAGAKNPPPPASSGKPAEHHQVGGTGLTDNF